MPCHVLYTSKHHDCNAVWDHNMHMYSEQGFTACTTSHLINLQKFNCSTSAFCFHPVSALHPPTCYFLVVSLCCLSQPLPHKCQENNLLDVWSTLPTFRIIALYPKTYAHLFTHTYCTCLSAFSIFFLHKMKTDSLRKVEAPLDVYEILPLHSLLCNWVHVAR